MYKILFFIGFAAAYPKGSAICDGGRRMSCRFCVDACGAPKCGAVNKLEFLRTKRETRNILRIQIRQNIVPTTFQIVYGVAFVKRVLYGRRFMPNVSRESGQRFATVRAIF